MYDILIIGAGPAGMTAALYGLRLGKRVLLIEKEHFGGQIVYSPRIENYPGLPGISGNEFADRLLEQILSLGCETEIAEIRQILPMKPDAGQSQTFQVISEEADVWEAKSVILATGVKHRLLGLEKEESLTGEGLSYCALCDGAFFQGKEVAVAGGGNTALQDALFLSSHCKSVYLIHRREQFRGEPQLLQAVREKENITILTDHIVFALLGETELKGIAVRSQKDGTIHNLPVEGLFVAIGQIPDNIPFSSLVQLDREGYVLAGEDCHTSLSGIFTAGDCRKKDVRQLATAVSDGAAAAVAACQYLQLSGDAALTENE